MANEKDRQEAKFASSKVKKGKSSTKRGKGIHKLESIISKDGKPNCSSSNPSNNLALPVLNPVSQSIDCTRRDTEQLIAEPLLRQRRNNITNHPTSSRDARNCYQVPSENVQRINRELLSAEPLSDLPLTVTCDDEQNINPNINLSLALSSGKMSTQRKNPCNFVPNMSNARGKQQNNACSEANKYQTRNLWNQTSYGEKENGGYQNEGFLTSGSALLIRQSMQPLLPSRRYQVKYGANELVYSTVNQQIESNDITVNDIDEDVDTTLKL